MQTTIFTVLFALLLATACEAFAPMTQGRVETCLNIQNSYLRGGKPSWEYETETMYIDESLVKAAPKKATKKPAAKKESKAIKGKMTLGEFFSSPFGN